MRTHRCPDIVSYERFNTRELRQGFLLDGLFTPGTIDLVYTDLDRAIVGSAVPLGVPLALTAGPALRAEYFCERRELGILNVGGPGSVAIDGKKFPMAKLDTLYVSRGSREVVFAADDHGNPPLFYLVSYPAHAVHPTTHATPADANVLELGARETANERRLSQVIHENGVKSCQLVMGFTELKPGGVWNTMPPHTHMRRSEVYLYFNLGPADRVVHLMGPAHETRHIVVANKQVVVSPGWSIHAGVGTASYSFCWGMGGENQVYSDMDPLAIADLL